MEVHEEGGEVGRIDQVFGEVGHGLGGEVVGLEDFGDDGVGLIRVGEGLFAGFLEGCAV